MLYMVIETFTEGPGPVYERFAASGRMLPTGLEYIDSWVESGDQHRCFQLMRTDDPTLFDDWIERWADITSFEVIEVVSSPDAAPPTS